MVHPRTIRWTKEEYFRLYDEGFFNGRRVELIDGEIVEMSPQNNPHAAGVTLALAALGQAFGPTYWPRGQATLDLSPHGCPDPDVAVVPGTPRDYVGQPIPTSALLVVQVSDSTLADDRYKVHLFAAGSLTDYWIVNIPDRQLEVYRGAVADPSAPFGFRYGSLTIFHAGDVVSPLALPTAQVAVADLLP